MKNKANSDIRTEISKSKFPQYLIAEKLGISEFTLVRWLRKELPDVKKNQVIEVIERLKREESMA